MFDQGPQFGFEDLEAGYLVEDLGLFGSQKAVDVTAGGGTGVSDVQHAADLVQSEPGRLGVADESDSVDHRRVVAAVAVRLSLRLGQEASTLVEPDGPCREPTSFGYFPDAHQLSPYRLTFFHGSRFTVGGMKITLLYFDGCPNWVDTDQHLQRLNAEHPELTVTRREVTSPEEAERLGFRGSPSVLIDGIDPFADPDSPVGLACRVYQTPDGPAGSPTYDQLRAALTTAGRS